jgi:hypothetical protein
MFVLIKLQDNNVLYLQQLGPIEDNEHEYWILELRNQYNGVLEAIRFSKEVPYARIINSSFHTDWVMKVYEHFTFAITHLLSTTIDSLHAAGLNIEEINDEVRHVVVSTVMNK